jgi:hypothetical protein
VAAGTGGLFFLGMATTLGLVYLLPGPHGRMSWALIVAAVMLTLGMVTLLANAAVMQYLHLHTAPLPSVDPELPYGKIRVDSYLVQSNTGSESRNQL